MVLCRPSVNKPWFADLCFSHPSVIKSECTLPCCPRPQCGGSLLSVQKRVLVCGYGRIHWAELHEYVCARAECTFQSFDGAEQFLLRKCHFKSAVLGTFDLCFTWQLLYAMSSGVTQGRFTFAEWQVQLRQYRAFAWSLAELAAMQSFYPHVLAGFMDFNDLMQHRYRDVLRCTCVEPGLHMSMDGITIAIKRKNMHLEGSWLPQPVKAGEPLVAALKGSKYADRLVIRSQTLRVLLRELASAKGALLPNYLALLQLCADAGDMLAPLHQILQRDEDGGCVSATEGEAGAVHTVAAWARGFLSDIGCDGPACALITIKDYAAVSGCITTVKSALAQDTLAGALAVLSELGTRDDRSLAESLPRTWPSLSKTQALAAVRSDSGNERKLCTALCSLFEHVLQARLTGTFLSCCTCVVSHNRWHHLFPAHVAHFSRQSVHLQRLLHHLQYDASARSSVTQRAFHFHHLFDNQVVVVCYTPSGAPVVRESLQPQHVHAFTRRVAAPPARSEEEGYFRTGLYSSYVTPEQAARGTGYRNLPVFDADSNRSVKDKAGVCTKHKFASGALSPGLQVRLSPAWGACSDLGLVKSPHGCTYVACCRLLGRDCNNVSEVLTNILCAL